VAHHLARGRQLFDRLVQARDLGDQAVRAAAAPGIGRSDRAAGCMDRLGQVLVELGSKPAERFVQVLHGRPAQFLGVAVGPGFQPARSAGASAAPGAPAAAASGR
jgi:hypothetical protein